jgi:hypothetical protein
MVTKKNAENPVFGKLALRNDPLASATIPA